MAKGFKDENGKFRPTGNKTIRDIESDDGDDVNVTVNVDNIDELEEFAKEKAESLNNSENFMWSDASNGERHDILRAVGVEIEDLDDYIDVSDFNDLPNWLQKKINELYPHHFEKLNEETDDDNKIRDMSMKEFIDYGDYLEDEVKRRAEKHGSHFFDKDTMRFFSSRVSELMWVDGDRKDYETNPIYFITSEQDRGPYKHSGSTRAFSVRKIDEDGDIDTIGEFQGYSTLNEARKAIKEILSGE